MVSTWASSPLTVTLATGASAFDQEEAVTECAHRIRMVDGADVFQLGHRARLAVLDRDPEQLAGMNVVT